MTTWKLIRNEGPVEWDGKHSIFVDVVDEQGKRLTGIPVKFWWNDGYEVKRTEAKTGEPFAVDFPMFAAGDAYGAKVDDGNPGDQTFGMGLIPFHPHVCYKLVFRRSADSEDVGEGPQVPGKDKIQVLVNGVVKWEN